MADELFQDRGEERKELDSNQNDLGLNPLPGTKRITPTSPPLYTSTTPYPLSHTLPPGSE